MRPRAVARSRGGTSSKVVNDKLSSSRQQLGSESRKKSWSFCQCIKLVIDGKKRVETWGEDRGDVGRGDSEREVKEATQAVSTSGQTFSKEQLDTSNQVTEEEAATSSR